MAGEQTSNDDIDRLLTRVSEINEELLLHCYINCFRGIDYEAKRNLAKEDIKKTFEYETPNETQNFIMELARGDDDDKKRLAKNFLFAMKELTEQLPLRSYVWEKFILDTNYCARGMWDNRPRDPLDRDQLNESSEEGNSGLDLHTAVLVGNSDDAKKIITAKNTDQQENHAHTAVDGETTGEQINPEVTPAAGVTTDEVDNEERTPPDNGTSFKVDKHERTPLHYAAMAIHPDAEIAKLLVKGMTKEELNKHSDKANGWNTALHVAASNVNVTQEFINAFKAKADPELLNLDCETAFHVAAKSNNPKAILYMLDAYAPTKNGWDVDRVDILAGLQGAKEKNKQKNRFCSKILCCKRKPAAESGGAVQQHDREDDGNSSNKSPKEKREKNRLINICARKGNAEAVALLIKNGADISKGVLHEIVSESVNKPEKIGKLKEVYQAIVDNAVTWRCLEKQGVRPLKASKTYKKLRKQTMVWLLRQRLEAYGGKDVLEYAISLGASEMFKRIINTTGVLREELNKKKVQFDVTNFTKSTTITVEPADENGNETQSGGNADNTSGNRHKCDVPNRPPKIPYLTRLLGSFDQWKYTDILSTQPLKELTNIFFVFIQRMYFVIGVAQLIFMALFSVHYTPTVCYLSDMFNLSNTYCSNTDFINNNESSLPTDADNTATYHRSLPKGGWLFWPVFLLSVNVVWSIFKSYYSYTEDQYKLRLVYEFVTESLLLRIFCCLVFGWFHRHRYSVNYAPYVEITAMVNLFGWLTCVEFFAIANRHINVSMLLVKQIIKKDIPGFLLFFAFTVVGFTFALHSLRMSTCELNEQMTLRDSFYGVLSSAFGIGGFYDVLIEHSHCGDQRTLHMIEIVYFAYVAVTLIILLNLLIAMMNNRYEIDKERAENIWRYKNLSMVRALESYEDILEKLELLDKYNSLKDYVSDRSKVLIRVFAIVCCFWNEYQGLPKPMPKRKNKRADIKTVDYYYLTIRED